MVILMNKFGTVLTSRQSGKEAFAAFLPLLKAVVSEEAVTADLEGVSALSPSWGDEFLTPLHQRYGNRLTLRNTGNASVALTIQTLEKANKISFQHAGG